jgi:hypothetical protein
MKEYPIPDFEKYFVTEDGQVVSYYGRNRRILKQSKVHKRQSKNRIYCYVHLQIPGTNKKKSVSLPRLILAAKLGRWLQPWEQARHLDGDCNNNHMDNLQPGCVINNLLDDIENGTRETDAANIVEAIRRLEALQIRMS